MISFLPPWGKMLIAATIAALGVVDASDLLPVKWDDALEGAIAIMVALGATATKNSMK